MLHLIPLCARQVCSRTCASVRTFSSAPRPPVFLSLALSYFSLSVSVSLFLSLSLMHHEEEFVCMNSFSCCTLFWTHTGPIGVSITQRTIQFLVWNTLLCSHEICSTSLWSAGAYPLSHTHIQCTFVAWTFAPYSHTAHEYLFKCVKKKISANTAVFRPEKPLATKLQFIFNLFDYDMDDTLDPKELSDMISFVSLTFSFSKICYL